MCANEEPMGGLEWAHLASLLIPKSGSETPRFQNSAKRFAIGKAVNLAIEDQISWL